MIETEVYEELAYAPDVPHRPLPAEEQTLTKRLASWLSSVHFDAVHIELAAQKERWARTVGTYLWSSYEPVAHFGSFAVLQRRGTIP